MRQFRVAFIELICRTANITEAEEIEMRWFGSPNAVVRIEARQQEGDQQNAEQAKQLISNENTDKLPQNENHIEPLNKNSTRKRKQRRHSIGSPNAVVRFEEGQVNKDEYLNKNSIRKHIQRRYSI